MVGFCFNCPQFYWPHLPRVHLNRVTLLGAHRVTLTISLLATTLLVSSPFMSRSLMAETARDKHAVVPLNKDERAIKPGTTIDTQQAKEARRLFQAVSRLLSETAEERSKAHKLPSESDFLVPPLWRETKEQRMQDIQNLLEAALDVVTDVPLVNIQKRIESSRSRISLIEDQITSLREKRLSAPDDAMLPGILTDTVTSLDEEIEDLQKRIRANKKEIDTAYGEIHQGLRKSGVDISRDQLELLLGSVVGGDMIKMVAAFQAARQVDERLGDLMTEAEGEIKTSRRYFAMHAALFAMLLHAQNHILDKIDNVYMNRMHAILKDIRKARALGGEPEPDEGTEE